MKRIVLAAALLLLAEAPFAGSVTFDAQSISAGNDNGTTSYTWNHAVAAGSNRMLVVGLGTVVGDSVSAVTYAGVSMTHLQTSSNVGNGDYLSVWMLPNPNTGTNAIVVTQASDYGFGTAVSLTGAFQNISVDNVLTSSGSFVGTGLSRSLTPNSDSTVVIDFIYLNNVLTSMANSWSNASSGAGTGGQSIGEAHIGPVSPASLQTSAWTWASSNRSFAQIILSIAAPASAASWQSFNGNE